MLINWTEIIGKCCYECKFLEIGFEKEFLGIRTDVYIFFQVRGSLLKYRKTKACDL